jgi:hypothetical protein
MYKRINVKCPLSLSAFNETWTSTDFKKISNTKFHETPSSVSQVVLCGQMDARADTHAGRHDSAFAIFWTREKAYAAGKISYDSRPQYDAS